MTFGTRHAIHGERRDQRDRVMTGKSVQFHSVGPQISVNVPTVTALLSAVTDRLSSGQGFALATINLDHLVKLGRDQAFARAYAAHDLIVADGNPIVWLSRLAHRPVSLVPGSELVLPLARLAASTGRPLVLIGSTAESLDGAAASLMNQVPGLVIAARIAPPMGFDPEGPAAEAILTKVAAIGPCLCFLALGAPKQESLAARGRQLAPQAGFASVGAGLDFLSGHQTRAPHWARALALEWLWRALSAPRRLIPRYLACAAILPKEVIRAIALRRA